MSSQAMIGRTPFPPFCLAVAVGMSIKRERDEDEHPQMRQLDPPTQYVQGIQVSVVTLVYQHTFIH